MEFVRAHSQPANVAARDLLLQHLTKNGRGLRGILNPGESARLAELLWPPVPGARKEREVISQGSRCQGEERRADRQTLGKISL